MQLLRSFPVLVLIAARSLLSHKLKSAIVGAIMFVGTLFVVVGSALLADVEGAMSKSIIGSAAGHLQIYSKSANDPLALFNNRLTMHVDDVGSISDVGEARAALETIDNIAAIVPMGGWMGMVSNPSDLDRALMALREAVRAQDSSQDSSQASSQDSSQDGSRTRALAKRVRRLAELMRPELANSARISADRTNIERGLADLDQATSDEFWSAFDRDPLEGLEFLDTHVGPLSSSTRDVRILFTGADLDAFAKNFDRLKIVDGELVPSGKRGFLFNRQFYEEQFKNRTAYELDGIYQAIVEMRAQPASDTALASKISELPNRARQLLFQLDPEHVEEISRQLPGDRARPLEDRLREFLTVDASNIKERREFFYRVIAPAIALYDVKIGDTMTLRAFTRSGYLTAANIRVYGTFEFKGLERSDFVSSYNLIDLVTFRELYGAMTDKMRAETESIRSSLGVKVVAAANAEDELFGDPHAIEAEAKPASSFDEFEGVKIKGRAERLKATAEADFERAAVEHGLALNAAIILKDPAKAPETAREIARISAEQHLGLQVVDWQKAAGIIGEFVSVMRMILYVSIAVIFLVAMLIINNAIVTAMMNRVTEIGTMRAIGAQRSFVLGMFLLEVLMLGGISGGAGALTGAGIVSALGKFGIAATSDALAFLFAGPRLFPTWSGAQLLFGMTAVLLVSVVSALHPARLAARVQPIVAMQAKE